MRSVFDGTVRVQARLGLGCLYLFSTLCLVPCVKALPAFKSACWHKDAKTFLVLDEGCEGEERSGGEDSASVHRSPCLLQTNVLFRQVILPQKSQKDMKSFE